MRRSLLLLLIVGVLGSNASWVTRSARAQAKPELYYTFFGQKIALTEQTDAIAVNFKTFRGRGRSLHQQLEADLTGTRAGRSRGGGSTAQSSGIEVKSLGAQFAIVKLAANVSKPDILEKIQQQDYVQSTLPVLSRTPSPKSEPTQFSQIVLPNEIIVSFAANLAPDQISKILETQKLDVVRKLRFSQNRYVVKSRQANGVEILRVANGLAQVTGIDSATPNFIQSIQQDLQPQAFRTTPIESISPALQGLPEVKGVPFASKLLPLQWHLNSTARRGNLARTDVRATDAWKHSHSGDQVVVAVIDSVIQWDHPDLKESLYTLSPNTPDALPGETHGWDFVENDSDTRLEGSDLTQIQPLFRNSFELSDATLIKRYAKEAKAILEHNPNLSSAQVAKVIRNSIQSFVMSQFHGTWSAGVIAAQPHAGTGIVGVAPKAKILPIRGLGLDGVIRPETQIEAIGYAAARKADVINMSFGGALPSQAVVDQVFSVLDANPKLVMVGSAGNSDVDGVAFPAAIPGVLSVGATNLMGEKAPYSSFGQRLDLVAPGGDTSQTENQGILTTGGTWIENLWQGVNQRPQNNQWAWGTAFDPMGQYVQVQGTSFSAPIVSGIVALMKSEDPDRKLSRDRVIEILKQTASYDGLKLTKSDENRYRLRIATGISDGILMPIRASGIQDPKRPVSMQQYYFGRGLVNAEAAVQAVKDSR
ncbi:S8 family peptidase [Leptolyngbya sp. GGD]|uniref:S8 family peptidase n=1 Tax=Leptolyngbya sp. GGD TaxID=2997907 RepID=UPI00227D4C7E|nr:S8 family serine peptidase [Leptolyngbya sp. GGD]MCY6493859.1 S8 family serine peptidase [Leptolyngbya sp. GGD]